jgi:hypothetical protein
MTGTLRSLTPKQQAAAADRECTGRIDRAALTGAERRERGLMSVRETIEHERLADISSPRRADRSRGPDPDDVWADGDPS